MPKRIQRKRTQGWRMPEGAVYVGRPTKWGNPFGLGGFTLFGHPYGPQTRDDVVTLFRFSKDVPDYRAAVRDELRGKALVCWCPLGEPCHADVLLEWANAGGAA